MKPALLAIILLALSGCETKEVHPTPKSGEVQVTEVVRKDGSMERRFSFTSPEQAEEGTTLEVKFHSQPKPLPPRAPVIESEDPESYFTITIPPAPWLESIHASFGKSREIKLPDVPDKWASIILYGLGGAFGVLGFVLAAFGRHWKLATLAGLTGALFVGFGATVHKFAFWYLLGVGLTVTLGAFSLGVWLYLRYLKNNKQ